MKLFIQTFIKILGFLFAVLFFIILVGLASNFINNKSYFSYFKGDKKSDQKIAILYISGPIISEPINYYNFEFLNSSEAIFPSIIEEYLNELEKKQIVGLIISINSQGGSVSASQKIYNLLNNFKKKNNIPLYFHSSDVLASGGYWISLSGDKIFADYGTIIGSIGVKGPDWLYYNSPTSLSTGLLGNSVESPSGIKLFSNTAGVSKDIFNPFREPSEKEKNKLKQMVNDIYDDFVTLVSKNRKIEKTIIKNKIGAMIFNTQKAQQLYLIDAQKGIEEVIESLVKELKLDSKKIITNKNKTKLQLLYLKILSYLKNEKLINQNKIIIKNKFCNNLFNEFSAVSVNFNNANC